MTSEQKQLDAGLKQETIVYELEELADNFYKAFIKVWDSRFVDGVLLIGELAIAFREVANDLRNDPKYNWREHLDEAFQYEVFGDVHSISDIFDGEMLQLYAGPVAGHFVSFVSKYNLKNARL